jgi:hypothetical protein
MGLQGQEIRQAFEVEQIATRRNYTFEWNPEKKKLIVWDTSRDVHKKYFDEDATETAYERFCEIYKTSISMKGEGLKAPFLWWVDPDTVKALGEDEDDLVSFEELFE